MIGVEEKLHKDGKLLSNQDNILLVDLEKDYTVKICISMISFIYSNIPRYPHNYPKSLIL